MTFALPTCSCAWLRHVNSHSGQGQVGEPPAFGLGQRGHAEAPVQLVPLQRLQAWADPALQPARSHAARRGVCHRSVEDEDGERSSKKHQEPHCQISVLLVLYSWFNLLNCSPFFVSMFVVCLLCLCFVIYSCFSSWVILGLLPLKHVILCFVCICFKSPCPPFFFFIPLYPMYSSTFDSSLLCFCCFLWRFGQSLNFSCSSVFSTL